VEVVSEALHLFDFLADGDVGLLELCREGSNVFLLLLFSSSEVGELFVFAFGFELVGFELHAECV
jgi:hypothetical protein